MEFEYDGEKYRLERGVDTGRWLLFHNFPGRVGWRLVGTFEAGIGDEDIIDRAKVSLTQD